MYAVDKCIEKRDYLRFLSLEEHLPEEIAQRLDIELDFTIELDAEWLAILKATDFLFYEGVSSAGKKLGVVPSERNRNYNKDQIFVYDFTK